MADKPVNQAPEQSTALYAVYARKNSTTNDFSQIPENQFANAVGKTASNKGELFYIDANGDVAELTIGSNGALMYAASGLPAWLAPGTNGHILTMTAGVPTWSSAVPAALTQIGSIQTVSSAVASVVFTDIPSSGYSRFLLHGTNVVTADASDSGTLLVQVSTDNGSTFKTTSGNYYGGTTATTYLTTIGVIGNTSTFKYGNFIAEFMGLGNSGRATTATRVWSSSGISTTNIGRAFAAGTDIFGRVAAEADNAFRLVVNGGANISSGSFVLYGVTET